MTGQRLALALEDGLVSLPEAGRIAVFGPRAGADLSMLPLERTEVITGFRPDHDAFAGQGITTRVAPEGRYATSIISLPRAKAQARAMVAQAASVTDGRLIIDGAKSDGVESLLKACRNRTEVSAPLSKAHGKLFSFAAAPLFDDWIAQPQTITDGFVTAPGVFSADGIDPGSRLLADNLPAKLGAQVGDLGGGWGYLSARALERDTIEVLHLVEADHAACDCARRNVSDARLQVHWDDVTRWKAPARLNAVISNPPFHTDRAADPGLGRAFIAAAARALAPSGTFWMVANRHLPYEDALRQTFNTIEELPGDGKFKIIKATRPARQPR